MLKLSLAPCIKKDPRQRKLWCHDSSQERETMEYLNQESTNTKILGLYGTEGIQLKLLHCSIGLPEKDKYYIELLSSIQPKTLPQLILILCLWNSPWSSNYLLNWEIETKVMPFSGYFLEYDMSNNGKGGCTRTRLHRKGDRNLDLWQCKPQCQAPVISSDFMWGRYTLLQVNISHLFLVAERVITQKIFIGLHMIFILKDLTIVYSLHNEGRFTIKSLDNMNQLGKHCNHHLLKRIIVNTFGLVLQILNIQTYKNVGAFWIDMLFAYYHATKLKPWPTFKIILTYNN